MEEGTELGRWKLLREVGRGGAGVVHLATGPDGEQVAVKLLKAGKAASEVQRQRFQAEVQALIRLRHPHMVRILDAGEAQGTPFLALEWIEGETLEARLVRAGPLEPAEAASLVEKLARALEGCHAQGLVHRDVKPSNVLLRGKDTATPLLTDFGLVKDLDDPRRLSKSGAFLGTPGFCPLEQAKGDHAAIGPATDVWGLGALLFAALTAQPPVQADTVLQLMAALQRTPAPPSSITPGIPPELDALCVRALAVDPARRPSAARLADELLRWSVARAERLRWARPAVFVPLLVLAGGALALSLALRAHEPDPPPSDPRANQVADLVSRATTRFVRDDHAAARALVGEALALDPESVDAWYLRATLHAEEGAFGPAEADFDRVIALDPEHVGARTQRGALRERRDDLLGATADLERAVELDPLDGDARGNLGALRVKKGDLEGALRDFEEAARLDPENGRVELNRGILLHRKGDLAGARRALDRAVAIAPDMPDAWCTRGAIRERQDELKGALSDYARAIELGSALGHANRGRILALEGKTDEAMQDLDRAIELAPTDPDPVVQRGYLRQQAGDLGGALKDFERFLELAPDDPRGMMIRLLVGNLRQRLGRT